MQSKYVKIADNHVHSAWEDLVPGCDALQQQQSILPYGFAFALLCK